MRTTVLTTIALAALFTLGIATPAQADTVTFDYTVTAADPMSVGWPLGGSGCVQWTGAARHFDEVEFFVTATGTYDFVDQRLSGDGRLALLTSAYDPADTSNCFAEVDDSGSIMLTAGVTYTMMRAGWDGSLGGIRYSVSGPGALTFVATPTATTVVVTPNPVTVGAAATLTAAVAGISPTGTVEFFDGVTSLGSAPVIDGAAALSVSTLALGDHAITAVYSGDVANLTSTSLPTTLTVAVAAVAPAVAATLPDAGVEAQPLGLGALALLLAGIAMLATRRITRLASRV